MKMKRIAMLDNFLYKKPKQLSVSCYYYLLDSHTLNYYNKFLQTTPSQNEKNIFKPLLNINYTLSFFAIRNINKINELKNIIAINIKLI